MSSASYTQAVYQTHSSASYAQAVYVTHSSASYAKAVYQTHESASYAQAVYQTHESASYAQAVYYTQCFPKTELVHTSSDEYTPIGSLKVGDKLMSWDALQKKCSTLP